MGTYMQFLDDVQQTDMLFLHMTGATNLAKLSQNNVFKHEERELL
jgi:hypothetical protein